MRYWLVKTDPERYSWYDLVKGKDSDGAVGVEWSWVNHGTSWKRMKMMRRNDRVFIYHITPAQRIMGVARVTREYYKAPTNNPAIDLEAIEPLVNAVNFQQIKDEPRLQDLEMIRAKRLSVTEIDPASWTLLCSMGGIPPQV